MLQTHDKKAETSEKPNRKKSRLFQNLILFLVIFLGGTLMISSFVPQGGFLGSMNQGIDRWYTQHFTEPWKKHEARKEAESNISGNSSKDGIGVAGANGSKATNGPRSYLLDSPSGSAGNGDAGVVTFKDSNSMGSYIVPEGDPLKTGFAPGTVVDYAPEPDQSFRNAKCNMTLKHEADPGSNNSWSIPSISSSAGYTITGEGSLKMALPNAPMGTENADTSRIGDTTGSILQMGHVNEPSGKVSPWGHLHQINACDHVYQRGTDGKVHEFVVTDAYTVFQKDFAKEQDLWRAKGDGSAKLYMVTCSGATLRDDGSGAVGGTLYFNYEKNLIVGAVPIS